MISPPASSRVMASGSSSSHLHYCRLLYRSILEPMRILTPKRVESHDFEDRNNLGQVGNQVNSRDSPRRRGGLSWNRGRRRIRVVDGVDCRKESTHSPEVRALRVRD